MSIKATALCCPIAHDSTRALYELIYQLHTGQGLWWLGLLPGFAP
jgi:hypothetical protein